MTTAANLARIAVVLVEPQGALNIGSVCRVMMNFGLSELRLVNPQADPLCDEARRMAVKAASVLEGARRYPTLGAALADCIFSVGTTRRFGKYREEFLAPAAAARECLAAAQQGTVALVFGREDRGLLTDELDLCTRFVTIPTDEALPSLNLAQAVAICLYELGGAAGAAPGQGEASRRMTAPTRSLEALYAHMRQTLLEIGYLDPQNPDHILRTFRRIFARAGLNERDVKVLQGLWSRIDWVESERRRLAQTDEQP